MNSRLVYVPVERLRPLSFPLLNDVLVTFDLIRLVGFNAAALHARARICP